MEFVTFHVSMAADASVHPNQTLQHREYLSMIDMMFASARQFHRGCRTTILSDLKTDFGSIGGVARHRIVRTDIDTRTLMLERANAQLNHVRTNSFERPLVVLDSDILINGRLDGIFDRPFDVAVTWRDIEEQPINGGFLILNNERPEMARGFFERFNAIYRERYLDRAAWFGDQLALRDCVGLTAAEMASRDMVEVEGCRIRLLPCDLYNFSPDNRYSEIATPLPEKLVLHFKGERKRLMPPFWRAWLLPRRRCSPLSTFAGWRAQRWLREQVTLESSTDTTTRRTEA